jgi:hypothetical protein
MREILCIALNDLRIFFRERGVIIGLVVIPLIMTVAIGLGIGGGGNGATRLRIDVIDNDRSDLSEQFLADLRKANTSLVLCPFDNDEEDFCRLGDNPTLDEARATERLRENIALALIEIPAGFEAQLPAGEPVALSTAPTKALPHPATFYRRYRPSPNAWAERWSPLQRLASWRKISSRTGLPASPNRRHSARPFMSAPPSCGCKTRLPLTIV